MFEIASTRGESFTPLFSRESVPVTATILRDTESGHTHHFSHDSRTGQWHYVAHFGANMYPFFSRGHDESPTINRERAAESPDSAAMLALLDSTVEA